MGWWRAQLHQGFLLECTWLHTPHEWSSTQNADSPRECRHAHALQVLQGHSMDRCMPAHLEMALEAKQDRSRFRCMHAPVQQLNVVAK